MSVQPLLFDLLPEVEAPRGASLSRYMRALREAWFPEPAAPRAPAPAASARLALLACSATKSHAPGQVPAVERYQGPLWQTARAVGAGGQACQLGFLSAAFGFGLSDQALPAYDARLSAQAGADLADRIRRNRTAAIIRPRGQVERAEAELRQLAATERSTLALAAQRAGRPLEAVCLVAGGHYLPAMLAAVEAGKVGGSVAPGCQVVIVNGPIGIMRARLRAWVGGQG